MSINYPHIASQVFNTPLLARGTLAEMVASFMAPRLLGQVHNDTQVSAQESKSYPVGDPEVGNRITVIRVHGILVQRQGNIQACEELMSYELLYNQLAVALNDPQTLAVVLDFHSGGGAAQGAFEMARAIREGTEKKPIHAVINYNAYSAAYLLASACTDIYISDTGGVGSIGVYYKRLDLTKNYENEGIEIHTFYRGGTKVFGHPDIAMSEEERAQVEQSIEQTYQMFVGFVSEFRGIDKDTVMETEADTYLGQAAIDIGLADHLMPPQQAINSIAAKYHNKPSRSIRAQAAALTM